MTNDITVEYVQSILNYDEDTGIFTCKKPRGSKRVGDIAGSITYEGYIRITIDFREYRAHRLAWLYTYGKWPNNSIDHINRIRSDNRICNLRDATVQENKYNTGRISSNTTGFRGVSLYKRTGKYQAKIRIDGNRVHLGYFNTAEEASIAYEAAAKLNFGEFYTEIL